MKVQSKPLSTRVIIPLALNLEEPPSAPTSQNLKCQRRDQEPPIVSSQVQSSKLSLMAVSAAERVVLAVERENLFLNLERENEIIIFCI